MSAAKRRRQKRMRADYVHWYTTRRGIVICEIPGCLMCLPKKAS